MPTIREDYQNAEWNVLCSALEDPRRFYELRREFSVEDFRDETSKAIFRVCIILLDAPDGIKLLRDEMPLRHALEDDLEGASPVYHVACEVLSGQRSHLREKGAWRSCLDRFKEITCRHRVILVSDKLQKAETIEETLSLANELTALQSGGRPSLAESATVDIARYDSISPRDAEGILPQPAWKGIQREGTLSIIAGASKARKSWFVLSKLQHALLNKPFLGREMLHPSTGKPRNILLLDFELPKQGLLSRYIALSGAFEDEEERALLFDPQRVCLESHRGNMGIPRNWVNYCCERIASYCEPGDLAVIDCLQPIMGDQDANLAQVIRPVIAQFQAAADSCGAVAEIVDHFNKSGEGTGMNRISGSMAKSAGPDTIITLNSQGPGITVELDLRMDPPVDKFQIEFKPFEFVVISEEQLKEREQAAKRSKLEEVLHETFPDDLWYSVQDLAKNLRITKEGARKRIVKLHDDYLEEKKEGRTIHYRKIDNSTSES